MKITESRQVGPHFYQHMVPGEKEYEEGGKKPPEVWQCKYCKHTISVFSLAPTRYTRRGKPLPPRWVKQEPDWKQFKHRTCKEV